MKKENLLILISIAFIFFSCASHAPIKQPNLHSNLEAQQNKQVLNNIEIMARPIHSKSEIKNFYDEDLILYGVLPFHLCFKNNSSNASCHIEINKAALIDPDGSSNWPLTHEQVYEKASKSYFRTAGWAVAFGVFGAVPSLINVAYTNEKIKADYESCMLKNGELVGGGFTEGSIFFSVDNKIESLDGWQLKVGFDNENNTKNFVTFELSGEVEQPRVPEHAGEKREK